MGGVSVWTHRSDIDVHDFKVDTQGCGLAEDFTDIRFELYQSLWHSTRSLHWLTSSVQWRRSRLHKWSEPGSEVWRHRADDVPDGHSVTVGPVNPFMYLWLTDKSFGRSSSPLLNGRRLYFPVPSASILWSQPVFFYTTGVTGVLLTKHNESAGTTRCLSCVRLRRHGTRPAILSDVAGLKNKHERVQSNTSSNTNCASITLTDGHHTHTHTHTHWHHKHTHTHSLSLSQTHMRWQYVNTQCMRISSRGTNVLAFSCCLVSGPFRWPRWFLRRARRNKPSQQTDAVCLNRRSWVRSSYGSSSSLSFLFTQLVSETSLWHLRSEELSAQSASRQFFLVLVLHNAWPAYLDLRTHIWQFVMHDCYLFSATNQCHLEAAWAACHEGGCSRQFPPDCSSLEDDKQRRPCHVYLTLFHGAYAVKRQTRKGRTWWIRCRKWMRK